MEAFKKQMEWNVKSAGGSNLINTSASRLLSGGERAHVDSSCAQLLTGTCVKKKKNPKISLPEANINLFFFVFVFLQWFASMCLVSIHLC